MNREKSCGIVIFKSIEGEIRYLLIQSRTHGDWGLPKGHVEKGETEEETALREVLEETGLTPTLIDGFREVVNYKVYLKKADKLVDKEVVYFLGRATEEDVRMQENEVSAFSWETEQRAYERLSHENARQVLRQAAMWIFENTESKI